MVELDIIIPVYNERENITLALDSLYEHVKTPFRVIICYDFDEDTTLKAIAEYPKDRMEIVLLKSPGQGPHAAIDVGIRMSTAPFVLTHMADDDYTSHHIDYMVKKSKEGFDIVTGSRFMKGGRAIGGPLTKQFLTWFVSFSLYHFARFPVQDATHGVRIFSRRVVDNIKVETTTGFTYSLEMMVKVHRLGWPVHEFPVEWRERKKGASRFKLWTWALFYLRLYFFAFATTWLGRGPETVPLNEGASLSEK